MEETADQQSTFLKHQYIYNFTEINPTLPLNVRKEKPQHYILSTSGNEALSRCMKDEVVNLPIVECERMTGELKVDRRPDIGNYQIHSNLQDGDDWNDISREYDFPRDRRLSLGRSPSTNMSCTNLTSIQTEDLTNNNIFQSVKGSSLPEFPKFISEESRNELLDRHQQGFKAQELKDNDCAEYAFIKRYGENHPLKNLQVLQQSNIERISEKQTERNDTDTAPTAVEMNQSVTTMSKEQNNAIDSIKIQKNGNYEQDDFSKITSMIENNQQDLIRSPTGIGSELLQSNTIKAVQSIQGEMHSFSPNAFKVNKSTSRQRLENSEEDETVFFLDANYRRASLGQRHTRQMSESIRQDVDENLDDHRHQQRRNTISCVNREQLEKMNPDRLLPLTPNPEILDKRQTCLNYTKWSSEQSTTSSKDEYASFGNREQQLNHVVPHSRNPHSLDYPPPTSPSHIYKAVELERPEYAAFNEHSFIERRISNSEKKILRRSGENTNLTDDLLHHSNLLKATTSFSQSPIETACRNQMTSRSPQGHEKDVLYGRTRRISHSPLILRASSEEEEDRPSKSPRFSAFKESESVNMLSGEDKHQKFNLQDPPRKFKRQHSNDGDQKSCVVPIIDTNEIITEVQELGTPKRLKPSIHEQLQKDSVVCQSPHIRTSSVIQTPKSKDKEGTVFIFPETTPTSRQYDYRFEVAKDSNAFTHKTNTIDSHTYYTDEPSRSTDVPTISPYKEYHTPPMKTSQIGYRNYDAAKGLLWTQGSEKHALYYQTQSSPEKQRTVRSQSNIEDQSPSKLSKEELDKIRYLRSISLPANEFDRRFSNRQTPREYYQMMEEEYRVDQGRGYQHPGRLYRHGSVESRVRCQLNFDQLSKIPETDQRWQPRTAGIHPYGMMAVTEDDQRFAPQPGFKHCHTSQCCHSCTGHPPLNGDFNRRRPGDINMRIRCSGISRECQNIVQRLQSLNHSTDHSVNCDCKRIEQDVLRVAMDAYSKIPRECYSQAEQRQMETELDQTNLMVLEAIKIAVRMKELCCYGRSITHIYNGSVVIRMNCPTLISLENLLMEYKSGELQTLINNIFITPNLLEKYNAKNIFLSVSLSDVEYQLCQRELASGLIPTPVSVSTPNRKQSPLKKSPDKRSTKSAEDLLHIPVSPKLTKPRCSSTPTLLNFSPLGSPSENFSPSATPKRERKFSFGDQSRRVFQDLNSPRSPGRKFNLEELSQIVENVNMSFQSRSSISRHSSPYSPLVPPKSPLNCSPLSPKRYSPR